MLSPREHEVLWLLASGYAAKEIAAILGVSRHTVYEHFRAIRQRLLARSLPHAVQLAQPLERPIGLGDVLSGSGGGGGLSEVLNPGW